MAKDCSECELTIEKWSEIKYLIFKQIQDLQNLQHPKYHKEIEALLEINSDVDRIINQMRR